MSSYFGFNELRQGAREHREKARSYRIQARNSLRFLKSAHSKECRAMIFEQYAIDCKAARQHSTLSRTLYACAHTWPKEAR